MTSYILKVLGNKKHLKTFLFKEVDKNFALVHIGFVLCRRR